MRIERDARCYQWWWNWRRWKWSVERHTLVEVKPLWNPIMVTMKPSIPITDFSTGDVGVRLSLTLASEGWTDADRFGLNWWLQITSEGGRGMKRKYYWIWTFSRYFNFPAKEVPIFFFNLNMNYKYVIWIIFKFSYSTKFLIYLFGLVLIFLKILL
jgi:hypothetical protein